MTYTQPLPQHEHPGPPWPLPTVSRGLEAIVADIRDANDHAVKTLTAVRADADEKIHALKVTAARLATQRDRLECENSALVAAAFVLVANGIRREEELQAQLRAAAHKAEAQRRIINGLEGYLDDLYRENLRLGEHARRLDADNTAVRAELRDTAERLAQAIGKRRFRRR